MNCRIFENQVADWRAGLLGPAPARRMADHRRVCPRCARLADSEEALRAAWRVSDSPAADLWPGVSARIPRDPAPAIVRGKLTLRAALCGAALVAMAAFGGLQMRAEMTPTRAAHIGAPAVAARPDAATPAQGRPAWLALSDVSQVNPAIDDPAGSSMEPVWTQINLSALAQAGGQ